jgi:hydroxyacylglutathione hydrolase
MILRQTLHTAPAIASSYLFGCGSRHVACVVDPVAEPQFYLDAASELGMRIGHVIDTHVHADHRSGGFALARQTGAAYRLHESAIVSMPFEPMREGEEIELGNTRVRVVHTPGHSPESVSLVVTDLKRGIDPWFVLTGDTLFVGAVGRPDLRGRARESAGDLFDSLHGKLLTLPDDIEIYPGHFSGSLCGTGLSGKPSSTMAFEKRWNPMLSLDRETFIDRLADVPPEPADMQQILQFNRHLATAP